MAMTYSFSSKLDVLASAVRSGDDLSTDSSTANALFQHVSASESTRMIYDQITGVYAPGTIIDLTNINDQLGNNISLVSIEAMLIRNHGPDAVQIYGDALGFDTWELQANSTIFRDWLTKAISSPSADQIGFFTSSALLTAVCDVWIIGREV